MRWRIRFIRTLLIAISLVGIGTSHAGASATGLSWEYSKSGVLDFLISWRAQIKIDSGLDEREKDLRTELIDRLAFQIDRKYQDTDLKGFLMAQSWDMALTDEMQQNKVWGGQAEFLKNLHLGLREILEPSENVLAFVRAFVEFSTLKKPKSFEQFSLSRSYSNGKEWQSADVLSLEEAGEIAAGEILQFKVTDPESSDSKTHEIHNEIAPDQNPNSLLPQMGDEHLVL